MERTTIQQLKDRIEGKVSIGNIDDLVVKMHHVFCQNYGWIPVDEFIDMPVGTFFSLMEEMEEEAKRNKDKMKSKGRR